MRQFLIASLLICLAATAFAGDNPDVYAYISFDPAGDEEQNTGSPTPYTATSVYVCLGGVVGGMTTVSFGINNITAQCPGVFGTQAFTNLLPGNLAIGDAFAGGVTVASTECMPGPVVVIGSVDGFYLGGDCCIEILDHSEYPRWVVDCQDPGVVDFYCLKYHGVIGAGECLTPTEWPCDSPIEDATWGEIKALYN
jgi:hypothetical protein